MAEPPIHGTDPAAGPNPTEETRRPAWSFQLARIAGIPIRVHASFALLLFWVAWAAPESGNSVGLQILLVAGLFGCVVLHELGHALTARLFGIRTRDITLYPIGGVSSLESLGEPYQELLISLAGPSVNIVITIVVAVAMIVKGVPVLPVDAAPQHMSVLHYILFGNLVLAIFNLVPAFPMDGGRILRAALALFLNRSQATQIAARVGQVLAILIALAGIITPNYWLVIIALFVFFGAGAEAEAQRTVATTSGYKMRDAMITRYETVSHGDTLGDVVERLLRTNQEDFPVVHGPRVLGILTRRQLLAALAAEGKEALVAGVMTRDFPAVGPDDDLVQALDKLKGSGSVPLLVFEGEQLLGMVTLDNLVEFLSVARAGGVPPPSR